MSIVKVKTVSILVGRSAITVTSLVTCSLEGCFNSEYFIKKLQKRFNNIRLIKIDEKSKNVVINLIIKSEVRCSPEDVFNEKIGTNLAKERNIKKANKQILNILVYLNQLHNTNADKILQMCHSIVLNNK